MKYLYFIWHEGFSSVFDWKVERMWNFEVHVFIKIGDVHLPLLRNRKADWYKLHEVNTKNDEMLFIALAMALNKISWSSTDELYLIDSNKCRCDDLFQELTSNASYLKKSLCFWEPSDPMSTVLSIFPSKQVCSKCSIVFESEYSKGRHERDRCSNCNELECCGDWGKHEKIFRHEICNSLECNFVSRRCCPNELEQHLKEHPKCDTCKTVFFSWFSNRKKSLSEHAQQFKICRFCKVMMCEGNHNVGLWEDCEKVKCDFTFPLCMQDKYIDHLSTHPECDCGCDNRFLNESKLREHKYPFDCKVCKGQFITSSSWLKHSKEESHMLNCFCDTCKTKNIYYSAKAKKMEIHLKQFGDSCICGEFFKSKELLGYHKKRCLKSSTVVAPEKQQIQTQGKASESESDSSVITVASIKWGVVDEKLVNVVNCNFSIVDCPIWTMTEDEKENLNALRKQIQKEFSSAKLFQLRVQGSVVKNTAIPAMADFDFILEVRNERTTMQQVKEEINEILKNVKCQFCYGDGTIQTWLTLDEKKDNILFDVVIQLPGDNRFQDFEKNVQMVKTQSTKVHSHIRALKYWCKRSRAPLKSFVIEILGIHLFLRCPRFEFADFLRFLQRNLWINEIDSLIDFPSPNDLKYLQDLAKIALNSLQPEKK